MVVLDHLGSLTVDIAAKPVGDTKVVGEVEYWRTENELAREQFFGHVRIRVANVFGSVRVRMKAYGAGSAVELRVRP